MWCCQRHFREQSSFSSPVPSPLGCWSFFGKLLHAPYHFLKVVRRELAAVRQAEKALEITFDPSVKADYLRLNAGLHNPQGEFYSIGVRNLGSHTLDDVTLRALPSWFTREAIAVAQGQSGNGPVEIFRRHALHPHVEESSMLWPRLSPASQRGGIYLQSGSAFHTRGHGSGCDGRPSGV
jgi:hypothetical protein